MKIICFLVVYFAVGFYSIILGQNSDSLPLNQYRVLASHNSYKNFPNQKVLRFLTKFKKQLGESNDPIQLDYGHLPLPEQFDQFGVRGIEIDINYDPNGGLYKKRKINMFIFGLRQKVRDKKMKEPGFKVLHIADVDYETNAFAAVRNSSMARTISSSTGTISARSTGSSPCSRDRSMTS